MQFTFSDLIHFRLIDISGMPVFQFVRTGINARVNLYSDYTAELSGANTVVMVGMQYLDVQTIAGYPSNQWDGLLRFMQITSVSPCERQPVSIAHPRFLVIIIHLLVYNY